MPERSEVYRSRSPANTLGGKSMLSVLTQDWDNSLTSPRSEKHKNTEEWNMRVASRHADKRHRSSWYWLYFYANSEQIKRVLPGYCQFTVNFVLSSRASLPVFAVLRLPYERCLKD